MKNFLLTATLLVLSFTNPLLAAPPVGEKLPAILLTEEDGEKVVGGAWSSESMKGLFHVLFYIDPDEKDLNEHAADAFIAAQRDTSKFGSVAIINMAATWLPNSPVRNRLKEKQKQYPKTVYVMDYKKVLVDQWHLSDHNNDLVIFAPDGTVLFSKDGEMTQEDIDSVIAFIREYTGPNVELSDLPTTQNQSPMAKKKPGQTIQ